MNKSTKFKDAIIQHYQANWHNLAQEKIWRKGPFHELPGDFCILEFAPRDDRNMWTYATCCMSQPEDERRIELHLFSPRQAEELVELLTVIAHYHRTGNRLDLGHTVNFGRSWLENSLCSYGLLSLPYLDGPELENAHIQGKVKCYWLIPITKLEVEFKKQYSLEILEEKFEEVSFNYLDPQRDSVV